MIRFLFAALAASLLACGTTTTSPAPPPPPPPPPPPASPPAAILILVQPSAEATNGAPLARQPVVRVVDANGQPVAGSGLNVRAVLASGTGEVSGGTVATDGVGRAEFRNLVIIGAAGPVSLRFESGAITSAASVVFQLLPGPAKRLELLIGNGQTAQVNTAVAILPAVQVRDIAGNPVAGVTVEFAAHSGGGSVQSGTAVSGTDGTARPAAWILGTTAGENTIHASSPAVPGTTIAFTATGTAGPATVMRVVSGAGPWVTSAGGMLAEQFWFFVGDQYENPVAGKTISLSILAGAGTVQPNQLVTDGDGSTVLPIWTAGIVPGLNRLQASTGGLAPVQLSMTGLVHPGVWVSASHSNSCAVDSQGNGWCWGANGPYGPWGIGNAPNGVPTIVGPGLVLAESYIGEAHGCRRTTAGQVLCSGYNDEGELGDGSTNPRPFDWAVAGGHNFIALAVGAFHTCAVRSDRRVLCWGRNSEGQLGIAGGNALVPTLVAGTNYTTISAGGNHTCALDTAGVARCWGNNESGQLGDGSQVNRIAPTVVTGGKTWQAISTGNRHTCGITTAGAAFCWGSGSDGQLGNGAPSVGTSSPVAVAGGFTFTRISAGEYHTCGITSGNVARCWGSNGCGQLGSAPASSATPVAVAGLASVVEISAGYDHTCAVATGGLLYCWGLNTYAQLGERGVVPMARTPIGVFPPNGLSQAAWR